MKKYAIIITCLALSAPLARSQATTGQGQSSAQTQTQPSASDRSAGTLPEPRSSSSTSGVLPGATGIGAQTNGAGTRTFGAGSSATQLGELDRNNSSANSAVEPGPINDPSGASRPTGLGTPPLTSPGVRTDSSASERGNTSTAGPSAINSSSGIPSSSATPNSYDKSSTSSTNSARVSAKPGTNSPTVAGGVITEPSGASTESASDRSLTQKLRQALGAEGSATITSEQNNSDLNISSRNGVVTLRGNVKNEGQKRSIEARLKNVDGVVSINNELKVSDKKAAPGDSSVNSSAEERKNTGSQDSQNKGDDTPSAEPKNKSSQN